MIIFCSLKIVRRLINIYTLIRLLLLKCGWYFYLLPWKMMRANKAKQTLVNFSETEFYIRAPRFSGHVAIVFFLLILLFLLLLGFFHSLRMFCMRGAIFPAFKTASIAICFFRFTDFIDSFLLPLPFISSLRLSTTHICQFISVRATAKWWIVHFIIIWCTQEFIYAKPEMSEIVW